MKTFLLCVIAVLAASSSNGFAADSFDQSIRPLLRDYPTHNLFHPDNGLFARTSHDGQSWSEPRRHV